MLNQYLLIICICIVLALTLYFFFWNRFVGFLIGSLIRLLWWNQEASSLWVEVGAIHFSLISGRILLKDVRYHTSNQTIKILKTQIQWRYWIRRPASEEEVQPTRAGKERDATRMWSCRVQLSFQGVEWFLYNRTAAYDNIISQMEKTEPVLQPTSSRNLLSRLGRQTSSVPAYPPSTARSAFKVPKFVQRLALWFKRQLPNLDPKELLPLGIDVQTGVIVLGNPSTPSLLVAEFQSAFGTFGICPSRSSLDLYKQVLGLKFQNALIQLVPNDDYVDPMTTIGGLIHNRIKQHGNVNKPVLYQVHRAFLDLWKQLHLFSAVIEYFADRRAQRLSSHPLHLKRKLGKAAAVDEDTPIGIDFSSHDYAVERKVLEAPTLDLTYYVDVVGEVPASNAPRFPNTNIHDIGNGDTPPEWGIDLVIHGGLLNYGPWTDRQRAELQRAFFPPTYQNIEVHQQLQPGDKRVWGALQFFVELRDKTTLHIPFREPSKDWQWDGLTDVPGRPKKRDSASIDVVIGDRSSINYTMPMIVGPSGYESSLEVHLDTISVTSSLNDIKLVSAESARIRAELPAPLAWDGERTWSFSIALRQSTLYLLRDHINMFTDLGKDWVSGPPTDYQRFIPMIYQVKLELQQYQLHLYLNDQNVIDKPLTKDENTLLLLRGHQLGTTVTLPSNTFRPESTLIPITVTLPNVAADILLPRWNSHATHAPKDGITFLKAKELVIDGSYRYFSEVHKDNMDKLFLGFTIRDPVIKLFGWTIRHFIAIKDNYFGSFTHFQTLNEYLEKHNKRLPIGDPTLLKYRPGKSNSMQIEVTVEASGVTTLLPKTVSGSGRSGSLVPVSSRLDPERVYDCLALSTRDLQVHVRLHDHFLELSLNMDVVTGTLRSLEGRIDGPSPVKESQLLTLDGLDILANRLFGPPPSNSTYICIWEIQAGRVNVSATPEELQTLAAVGTSFGINFADVVNSPAESFVPEVDPDVTFYKVAVRSVDLMCKVDKAALYVQLPEGLRVDTNDLGTAYYKKVLCVRIPKVLVKLLTTSSPERNSWLEAGEAVLDGYIDVYSAPSDLQVLNDAQAAFIEEQDQPTRRARLIFDRFQRQKSDPAKQEATGPNHLNGLYLPRPTLPTGKSRRPSKPKFIPHSSKRSGHARPPSWRHSAREQLSESEDDGVSELDRDAQLAKTRASTPVVYAREENGMSTGDESDDADLTDGNSTDDEWSDLADSDNQPNNSLFSFYSPVTRHYQLGSLGGLTLTRDGTLVRHTTSRKPSETSRVHPTQPPAAAGSLSVDRKTTTLRVRSRNGLQVVTTPLIAVVAASFQQYLENMPMEFESAIDSLIKETIGEALAEDAPGRLMLDLGVPDISLRLLQHIPRPGDHREKASLPKGVLPGPSNLDVTAVLDLTASEVQVTGCFSDGIKSLQLSLGQLSAELSTSIDKKTLDDGLSTLFFGLSHSSMSFRDRDLGVRLGQILFRVGHLGPELALTTAIALRKTAIVVARYGTAVQEARRVTTQRLFVRLLQASEKSAVIDPLSTIQPSYFVQSGHPQLLRTNLSFRFLYHLRTFIWNTANFDLTVGMGDSALPSASSILPKLMADRIELLEQDGSKPYDLWFYEQLGEATSLDASRPKVKHQLPHITLSIGHADVVILAPTGGDSSSLSIKDVAFTFSTTKYHLTQFNFNVMPGMSQGSMRGKPPRPLRRSAIIASVSNVSLTVLPHLMDFAQHILRIQRKLQKPSASQSSPTQEGPERLSIRDSKSTHFEILVSIRAVQCKLQPKTSYS